jgi:hypothetical protein
MVEVAASALIKRKQREEDDRGSIVTAIRIVVQFRRVTPGLGYLQWLI